MKHILLRLILCITILINSHSSFYPLAPKSQLQDLNMLLPGLGVIARQLVLVYNSRDEYEIRRCLILYGPQIFNHLQEIFKAAKLRVYSFEYKKVEENHFEVIFYLQNNNGEWIPPVVVGFYTSEDMVKRAEQLSFATTIWGNSKYLGVLGNSGIERQIFFYQLNQYPSDISQSTSFEMLYKKFILYAMYNTLYIMVNNLPKTFDNTRVVLIPDQRNEAFFGIRLVDSEVLRKAYITPDSLKDDRFRVYREDLFQRMEQFFRWIGVVIPIIHPKGIHSMESLVFFIKIELDALIREETWSLDQRFSIKDAGQVRALLNSIGVGAQQAYNNEIMVFERALGSLKPVKQNYRSGRIPNDLELAKEVTRILQEYGFLASILEINKKDPSVWYDSLDLSLRPPEKRCMVLVRVAGELLILDLSADVFMPRDANLIFSSQNPIPDLTGNGNVNMISGINFNHDDIYGDAGVVVIPVRYFWQEVMRVDFDREKYTNDMIRSFAVTLIADKERDDIDLDSMIEDLKEIMKLETNDAIIKRQKELAKKYQFKNEEYDSDVDDEEDQWEDVFKGRGGILFPRHINNLLTAYEVIVKKYKEQIVTLARNFYPYLGVWNLKQVDGIDLWSNLNIDQLLLDPLGVNLQLFMTDFLIAQLDQKLGRPQVMDISRISGLETAA